MPGIKQYLSKTKTSMSASDHMCIIGLDAFLSLHIPTYHLLSKICDIFATCLCKCYMKSFWIYSHPTIRLDWRWSVSIPNMTYIILRRVFFSGLWLISSWSFPFFFITNLRIKEPTVDVRSGSQFSLWWNS